MIFATGLLFTLRAAAKRPSGRTFCFGLTCCNGEACPVPRMPRGSYSYSSHMGDLLEKGVGEPRKQETRLTPKLVWDRVIGVVNTAKTFQTRAIDSADTQSYNTLQMRTQLLSVSEAATLFEVHPQTVYRWVKSGQLATVTLPNGGIRVERSVIERYIGGRRELRS